MDDLLVDDRYFLLLAIRLLAFGGDYEFKVRRDACGHTFPARPFSRAKFFTFHPGEITLGSTPPIAARRNSAAKRSN